MKLKQLFTEEDAVSPVIGVILMVAITVILAAVIGTFVLGLGDQVSDNAPQASFSFDYSQGSSQLVTTHDSGEKIPRADLSFSATATGSGDGSVTVSSDFPNTDVAAGDSATLTGVTSDEKVRIVWTGSEGKSSTLIEWTGPDA